MRSGAFVMWAVVAVIGLGGAIVPVTAAATAPSLTLEPLLLELRERHPGVAAAHRRWDAARERVSGEGVRPDPMVEAGVMSLSRLMGPQVAVTQTFPLGGKLDLARRQAEAEVDVARYTYLSALNQAVAEAKQAYYRLYVAQQALSVVERNKQLFQQTAGIAAARYAVGQGKQSDVVRNNAQIAEMLHEALSVRQQVETAEVTLFGLLNRPAPTSHAMAASSPRVVLSPMRPLRLSLETALAEADARNPELAEARAEAAAGESGLALARTVATPDLTARLGVGQAYMGMGWETVVSGMVGTNLPLGSRVRQASAVAAGDLELAARRSALEERRRQVAVQLRVAFSHVQHLDEQVRLYTQGLMPQGRQALKAELANYQVGKSDFDAVLSAQMSLYRYERELHEAIGQYHSTLADIEMLTGANVADQTEGPGR